MAEIWKIDVEENDFSDFTIAPSGSRLTVNTTAKMGGTAYGIEVDSDAAQTTVGERDFDIGSGATNFRLGFWINADNLTLGTGEDMNVMEVNCDIENGRNVFLEENGGNWRIGVLIDEPPTFDTLYTNDLGTGDYFIEYYETRETNATAGDGAATLSVGGTQHSSVGSLQSYEDWTNTDGLDSGNTHMSFECNVISGSPTGNFYLDEISIRNDATPIYSAENYIWHYNNSTWADKSTGLSNKVTGIAVKGGTSLDTALITSGDDVWLSTAATGTPAWASRDTFTITPSAMAPVFGDAGIDIVAVGDTSDVIVVEKCVNAESGTPSITNLTETGMTTNYDDGITAKGVA